MRDDTLVHWGGSVKALGDGKVGGYLVRFSDEASPDLTGDYFTKNTDFDVEDGDKRSTYYAHGLDQRMGVKKIGTLTVKTDDVGVWVEAQLKMRDAYEQSIYELAAKGKLGWSSGAPSHLVTRKSVEVKGANIHEILTWPIAEGSLTPTPAEPRNDAIALKSLGTLIGMDEHPAVVETETEAAPVAAAIIPAAPVGDNSEEIDTIIPPAGMSFDTQIDAALAAVEGVIVRGTDINDLRVKSGRVLSAANRSKLADLHGKMHETHGQMTAHMAALSELLAKTDPDAKKDVGEVAALRTQFLRMQSRQLGMTV